MWSDFSHNGDPNFPRKWITVMINAKYVWQRQIWISALFVCVDFSRSDHILYATDDYENQPALESECQLCYSVWHPSTESPYIWYVNGKASETAKSFRRIGIRRDGRRDMVIKFILILGHFAHCPLSTEFWIKSTSILGWIM